MNTRLLLLAAVAAVTVSLPALAQVPAELEGRLKELKITDVTTGAGSLKVFDTVVTLNSATTYSTPTREGLSLQNIRGCNNRVIPGFPNKKPSMIGGTAIVVGTSDPVTGQVMAESVFLEPAENVLLGRVTAVPTYAPDPTTGAPVYQSGGLMIDGTEIVVLAPNANTPAFPPTATVPWNGCFPGLGIKNDFGFAIDPSVLLVDDEAAAEGWYGEDGKFYAFLIETASIGSAPEMSVSVQRAQCRNRDDGMEWEIRGGVSSGSATVPANGTVEVGQRVPSPTASNPDRMVFQAYPNAFTNAVADPLTPMLGTYQFRGDGVLGTSGTIEPCPSTVIVRYSNTGSAPFKTARSGVDVR